jgi:hypothetical protein
MEDDAMTYGLVSTRAPRVSCNVRNLIVYQILRDLDQWRGLRPLGFHMAALQRRAGCDPAIFEQAVFDALRSSRPDARI